MDKLDRKIAAKKASQELPQTRPGAQTFLFTASE